MAKALGGSRQLVLEASRGGAPPVVTPPQAPVVTPPVINTPSPTPEPTPPAQTRAAPAATPQLPEAVSQAPKAPDPKAPDPTRPPANTSEPSGLDRQAKNLADFFNGQVLDVDNTGI